MAKINLSDRLKTVAQYIPPGSVVADIGSDHAYLPVYLVESGISPAAIAGEVAAGPFTSAESQIMKHGLQSKVKAKLGNGLAVLEGEAADVVVIAGMGGPLIASILEDGKAFLSTVRRLVLQPNVASDCVRRWLKDHNWSLIEESILEEDGHVYEVLVAAECCGSSLYSDELSELEKELWLGPLLLQKKNSAFQIKWKRELAQLEKISIQLGHAAHQSQLTGKKEEIERKIKWLKEELL